MPCTRLCGPLRTDVGLFFQLARHRVRAPNLACFFSEHTTACGRGFRCIDPRVQMSMRRVDGNRFKLNAIPEPFSTLATDDDLARVPILSILCGSLQCIQIRPCPMRRSPTRLPAPARFPSVPRNLLHSHNILQPRARCFCQTDNGHFFTRIGFLRNWPCSLLHRTLHVFIVFLLHASF